VKVGAPGAPPAEGVRVSTVGSDRELMRLEDVELFAEKAGIMEMVN